MPYLGATLSYDNFELKTFRNRAHCAKLRFQELRKVLRSNGALSARHRLRLYKATVCPALWYSLGSIGVTGEVLRGVVSVMERAGICPQQFFIDQAALKTRSIAADMFPSAELKHRELRRSEL